MADARFSGQAEVPQGGRWGFNGCQEKHGRPGPVDGGGVLPEFARIRAAQHFHDGMRAIAGGIGGGIELPEDLFPGVGKTIAIKVGEGFRQQRRQGANGINAPRDCGGRRAWGAAGEGFEGGSFGEGGNDRRIGTGIINLYGKMGAHSRSEAETAAPACSTKLQRVEPNPARPTVACPDRNADFWDPFVSFSMEFICLGMPVEGWPPKPSPRKPREIPS